MGANPNGDLFSEGPALIGEDNRLIWNPGQLQCTEYPIFLRALRSANLNSYSRIGHPSKPLGLKAGSFESFDHVSMKSPRLRFVPVVGHPNFEGRSFAQLPLQSLELAYC